MIVFEIPKDDTYLLEELKRGYPDDIFDVDSFGSDTLIQVIIPVVAILAPVVSPIILKLIADRNVVVKYEGYELTGDIEHVRKLIKEIDLKKASKKNDHSRIR